MTAPRRRPGPKRALSEAGVLDAALALMDADGPAAASIRRIAGELGVSPNAVYTYFPDKAAIGDTPSSPAIFRIDAAPGPSASVSVIAASRTSSSLSARFGPGLRLSSVMPPP